MADGMLDDILRRNPSYEGEIWTWLVIGVAVIFMRFTIRIRMGGPAGFKGDDYAMIATFLMYSSSFVVLDSVYHYGTNVDLTVDQIRVLSDEEVTRLVQGSKFQLAAWYLYTSMLWSMKGGVLLFYKRLTFDLWRNARYLTYLTLFTVLSYLAVVGTISFGCLPYHHNWGVRPLPSDRCLYKTQNLLVATFFNILTDVAILSLPILPLGKIRAPVYKRILIILLVCSGIYFITASIMRVVVTLRSERSTLVVNLWGTRELGVCLIATNAPSLRPLFSRRFWHWHYQPPPRSPEIVDSVRGSRNASVIRQRTFPQDSILSWINSTPSTLGTVTEFQGLQGPADEERV
ncbi:cation diffusion facilitator 1 protein [Colletotrichum incanum]|uniref:Cation diffusion facilitator 1 protein n=1 Tax=Colletotrichum incanum TaxID=1573173 RepID=A0A162Q3X9_COLIC|nr:cation diffusion facilitator 1 protein [Colletotrichum incanum]